MHQVYRYGHGSSLYGAHITGIVFEGLIELPGYVRRRSGVWPESWCHITALRVEGTLRDLLSVTRAKSSWLIEIERAFQVFRRKSAAENADPGRGARHGVGYAALSGSTAFLLDLLSRIPVARIGDG